MEGRNRIEMGVRQAIVFRGKTSIAMGQEKSIVQATVAPFPD